jgi:hypothetical protein
LKEEGYSDAEIAFILHGHTPAQPSKEELAHAEKSQDIAHNGEAHKQELQSLLNKLK